MTILPMHAVVECTDSPSGKLVAVIVNPAQRDVTHLVVKHLGEERLVPSAYISDIDGQTIRLYCSNSEMQEMELFAEKRFIRSVHPETPHMMAYPYLQGIPPRSSSYAIPMETDILRTEVLYPPPGGLALHHGADVWAKDVPVGHVSGLYLAHNSHHITHVVVETDGFFRQHEMVLPLTAIEHFENDVIYLKWDRQTIEQLPESTL